MKVLTALVNLALASSAVAVAVDSRATLPGFAERACGTTGGKFTASSPVYLASYMASKRIPHTRQLLTIRSPQH